jgi:hypothetical protein
MSKVTYIYGLVDPRSNEIKYIGKSLDAKSRLVKHLYEASRIDRKTAAQPKNKWIRSLLENGLTPTLTILEKVLEDGDWVKAERKWILFGRTQQWNLVNISKGGEGLRGASINFPEEAIALLGKVSDGEVGRKFGININTVQNRREILGIPSCETCRKHIRRFLPNECIDQFGIIPDAHLAQAYGVSPQTIRRRRKEVEKHDNPAGIERNKDAITALLGTMSDSKIAKLYNVGKPFITAYRNKLGISACYRR